MAIDTIMHEKTSMHQKKTYAENLSKNFSENFSGQSIGTANVKTINIKDPIVQLSSQFRIPKIKGLDFLKEGVYSLNIEKAISDMFKVIKNMEHQLTSVLKINAVLEKDLVDFKEVILDLKKERTDLNDTIYALKEEMPSKRELQIELEMQVEERNNAQIIICDLKEQLEMLQGTTNKTIEKNSSLEEQKHDYISEINFLESQLHLVTEKLNNVQDELADLKSRNFTYKGKIKEINQEYKDSVDEKYKLLQELKASKRALDELNKAFSEKKFHAKKSFYKNMDIEE